ncbi:hypothetical protein DMENIID0001_144270 [Sergentomyia squamirostris]
MNKVHCVLVLVCLVGHTTLANLATLATVTKMCENVQNNHFLKDFNRCENYYVCVNGVAHEGACPEPFFFNEATQACDHQRNVACRNCEQGDSITTMVLPESKTCDSFVRCIDGERELVKCPGGFIFDETLGRCNLASVTECLAAACTADMNPSTFTFVASKVDCRRYFICHQGVPTVRECATGLLFNPAIGGCDFEDNVVCTANGPAVPETVSVNCPPSGMVFRPHPTNCRQAFLCVSGDPQLISCTEHFAWDAERNTCVPEQQTSCV